MQTGTRLKERLAAIVGAGYVSDQPEQRQHFAVQSAVPDLVVAPATIEELSAVIQVSHEDGASVIPWGGGTQQWIGNSPKHVNLVVRTERLNRVLIHEPSDLTISVEAGMTLGALRRHLAAHNQMLPIDPPLPEQATIGGLLATAMDGPRRVGYGTLRDLLIGVTVVEATGRMSKAGGMVVKNVSGFDMMKLYHGSFGTLAVIAAANFKLLPAPRETGLVLYTFSTIGAAFAFLDDLHASQLTPAAAEYLSRYSLRALDTELDAACGVAVLAEGLPQAVKRHQHELDALAAKYGSLGHQYEDPNLMWAAITDLPQTARLALDEALIKLVTLPSQLHAAIAQIEAADQSAEISARALEGVTYIRLRGSDATRLNALLATLPGVQWTATPIAGVRRWGQTPEGNDTMRRIKNEFDPQGLLNPGRFIV